MPINLEIEIFIFLVRYVIVVLLVIVAFTCDKLFPHYMCLTLITIYCLAVAAQSVGPDARNRCATRVQQQQQQQQQQAAAVAAAWRHGHFRPADQDL